MPRKVPNVQSKNKKISHEWIDVMDQLPRDDEEVWVCLVNENYADEEYMQTIANFQRTKGWITPFDVYTSGDVYIHYWMPKPLTPNKPKWYQGEEDV